MNRLIATIVRFSVTVLVLFAKSTRGCGGYSLETDHIRNCNSDNIIVISRNFTVELTPNCQLKFSGCVTMREMITTTEVDYTFQKDAMKRSGKKDGCSQLSNKINAAADMGMDVHGLPKNCPINKGTLCLDNKSINVNKYKLQLHILAGHIKIKTLVTTDVGKACVEYSGKLVNKLTKSSFPISHGLIG